MSETEPLTFTIQVRSVLASAALIEALLLVFDSHAFHELSDPEKMFCAEHLLKIAQSKVPVDV